MSNGRSEPHAEPPHGRFEPKFPFFSGAANVRFRENDKLALEIPAQAGR